MGAGGSVYLSLCLSLCVSLSVSLPLCLSLSVSLLRNHGQASNPKSTLGDPPGSRLETAGIQEKLSLSVRGLKQLESRKSQKEPGAAMRSQEEPGRARRSHEEPGSWLLLAPGFLASWLLLAPGSSWLLLAPSFLAPSSWLTQAPPNSRGVGEVLLAFLRAPGGHMARVLLGPPGFTSWLIRANRGLPWPLLGLPGSSCTWVILAPPESCSLIVAWVVMAPPGSSGIAKRSQGEPR